MEVQKFARSYSKDEIIIKQGDDSNGEIFFLRKGQAAAEIGDKFVGTINVGEFFGEVAAILKAKRGATVRAIVPCECDVFKGLEDDKLLRIIQREAKIGVRMIQVLAKRLLETSVDSAGQIAEKEKLIERYRKSVSGAMFILEGLTQIYKAPYLAELLEHLSQTSGIQLGSDKDVDPATFKQTAALLKKN
jgi:CRP-like cAMP-binding protein